MDRYRKQAGHEGNEKQDTHSRNPILHKNSKNDIPGKDVDRPGVLHEVTSTTLSSSDDSSSENRYYSTCETIFLFIFNSILNALFNALFVKCIILLHFLLSIFNALYLSIFNALFNAIFIKCTI